MAVVEIIRYSTVDIENKKIECNAEVRMRSHVRCETQRS